MALLGWGLSPENQIPHREDPAGGRSLFGALMGFREPANLVVGPCIFMSKKEVQEQETGRLTSMTQKGHCTPTT